MRVETVMRFPVKSMLGQRLEWAVVGEGGLVGDRAVGLLDDATGLVVTAKNPRRWRRLLQWSASADEWGDVRVTSPTGWTAATDDPALAGVLSADLGRPVRVASQRPVGSSVERSDPGEVLERGVEAEVATPTIEIAGGTPGASFVDDSPVHLVATPTLERLAVDPVRYRPNLVVACEGPAFLENGWTDRELHVGDVVLRVLRPTPRCSVPTLEHGDLPRAPEAVRPLMTDNHVEAGASGPRPCAGVYARVVRGGTLGVGARVTLA